MNQPSSPSPRLVDVARRAGVSAAMASVALRGGSRGTIRFSEEVAERVRRTARQMNYRPNMAAQRLKGRKNDVIGVLIGAESTAANYDRLAALEQEAYRRGYRLMIGQFHGDSQHTVGYIEDFLSRGVDALICFHNPLLPSDKPVLKLLEQARALVFQTQPLLEGACCVDVDRAQGVCKMVEYLHGQGHQRIALVLNSPPQTDRLMDDRHRGYLAALQNLRLTLEPSLLWCGAGVFPPSRELADQAINAVVNQGKADAIVASNDVWAIELIKSLRRQGLRVPQDVAVVGFDNLDAAALFDPALTTIDQNNPAFAAAAVDLLLACLENQQLPLAERTRIVQPNLVIRESA